MRTEYASIRDNELDMLRCKKDCSMARKAIHRMVRDLQKRNQSLADVLRKRKKNGNGRQKAKSAE